MVVWTVVDQSTDEWKGVGRLQDESMVAFPPRGVGRLQDESTDELVGGSLRACDLSKVATCVTYYFRRASDCRRDLVERPIR